MLTSKASRPSQLDSSLKAARTRERFGIMPNRPSDCGTLTSSRSSNNGCWRTYVVTRWELDDDRLQAGEPVVNISSGAMNGQQACNPQCRALYAEAGDGLLLSVGCNATVCLRQARLGLRRRRRRRRLSTCAHVRLSR